MLQINPNFVPPMSMFVCWRCADVSKSLVTSDIQFVSKLHNSRIVLFSYEYMSRKVSSEISSADKQNLCTALGEDLNKDPSPVLVWVLLFLPTIMYAEFAYIIVLKECLSRTDIYGSLLTLLLGGNLNNNNNINNSKVSDLVQGGNNSISNYINIYICVKLMKPCLKS